MGKEFVNLLELNKINQIILFTGRKDLSSAPDIWLSVNWPNVWLSLPNITVHVEAPLCCEVYSTPLQ